MVGRASDRLHRVSGDPELPAAAPGQPRLREGRRLQTMCCGMDLDEREKIKQAFQADPSEEGAEVRILLATDTASEGIDLQNHCSKLIHVEIPWNPNVMEQRNGRIDRYGQQRDEVDIFHFVPAGYDHDALIPTSTPVISPATSGSFIGR
ncbi:MAG: helicase-related protein [Ilumatobacteraceae bacterium]